MILAKKCPLQRRENNLNQTLKMYNLILFYYFASKTVF